MGGGSPLSKERGGSEPVGQSMEQARLIPTSTALRNDMQIQAEPIASRMP